MRDWHEFYRKFAEIDRIYIRHSRRMRSLVQASLNSAQGREPGTRRNVPAREYTPYSSCSLAAGRPRRGVEYALVLSFLFSERLCNAHLPWCSRFILWICDAVALRYLRGRPLIFTAIPHMLAHAKPILEKMHSGIAFVRREYRRCDSAR